jgi:sulfur carrier protein ThiS
VKIVFKLYASLGSYLPPEARRSNKMDLDLPAGTTVLQAILGRAVPPERCSLVLVNGVFVALSQRGQRELVDGDVLAIWPPVAGG